MKTAALLSFSAGGALMADKIIRSLPGEWDAEKFTPKGNLKPLTAQLFRERDALIFVGACGIAVRAIAPNLISKAQDPAVLVVDEKGRFVISLLSGHIGGANELAQAVAAAIGAQPVITTATDVNGRFSPDAWAAKRGLVIESLDDAKAFSSEILKRDLPLFTDFPIDGAPAPGLVRGDGGDIGLVISTRRIRPFGRSLLLIPRILHLGLGCRKGISAAAVDEAVRTVLGGANLCPEAVRDVSTIDLKAQEAGLTGWAGERHLPVNFYSAAELNRVEGSFTPSEFVMKTVGTDNVCERAAARSAGADPELIVRKTGVGGVTVAVAQEKWSVSFD